jgi:ABC-type multidrug transport system fused ATPase/permease subunit
MREIASLTRSFIVRQPLAVTLVVACIAVAGALQFVPPLLMGRLLAVLLTPADHAQAQATITRLFTFIAISVLGILGFQFVANYGGLIVATAVSRRLRTRVHEAFLTMTYAERGALDAGTIQSRLADDCASIEGFFSQALPTIAIQTIFVSEALVLLGLRAPFLAPLVGVPVALLAIAALGVRRATLHTTALHAERLGIFNARIAELVQAARAIKLIGREQHQHERFITARCSNQSRALLPPRRASRRSKRFRASPWTAARSRRTVRSPLRMCASDMATGTRCCAASRSRLLRVILWRSPVRAAPAKPRSPISHAGSTIRTSARLPGAVATPRALPRAHGATESVS